MLILTKKLSHFYSESILRKYLDDTRCATIDWLNELSVLELLIFLIIMKIKLEKVLLLGICQLFELLCSSLCRFSLFSGSTRLFLQ